MRMTVKIIVGDLLNSTEDIIGHQVNCQGVMGSGVALALREQYSNLYSSYKQFCNNHTPHDLLGKCQIVKTGSKFTANLFGQLNYGRQKIRYTDYDALKNSLIALKKNAIEKGHSVALPFNIGCGLANGNWGIVEPMIQEVFIDYEVTLYKI
jgi:O-acetyl-ADP-ribose deacetylase (regulator of RNase III)